MSFPSHSGVYTPYDLNLIQSTFDRLSVESLLPASEEDRRRLARVLLAIYDRGVCTEDRLFEAGSVAVRSDLMRQGAGTT